MDKHLNYFWVYGRDYINEESELKSRSINNLENNITRNVYVTFDSLKPKNKVDFINRLIGKDILSTDKKYYFDYELQQCSKSEIVKRVDNKYLVGFCLRGDLGGTTDFNEIVDLISEAKANKDANPDLTIIVKDSNNNPVLAIVFENKKEPLKADQMRRHLQVYMGLQSKNEFKNHLIIHNYYHFFGLFEKYKHSERMCKELLEYMRFLCQYEEDIKGLHWGDDLEYEDKKKMIGSLGSRILEEVIDRAGVGGKLRLQSGWGQTINFEKKKRYINMIGLVYKDKKEDNVKEDLVELNIKFSPNMESARRFYKEIDFAQIENKGLSAHFAFGFKQQYYDNAKFSIESSEQDQIKKYFYFFKKLATEEGLEQVNKKEAKNLAIKLKDEVKSDIVVSDLTHRLSDDGKLYNVSPTLERKVTWPVSKLIKEYSNEKLVAEITKEIKKIDFLLVDVRRKRSSN